MLERTVEPLAERLVERPERPEPADADLLALLQALLPQPRYLWDLGIVTFPLARLNARLAPLGYVIEAKKVRDRARFVACTDAHGQVKAFRLFALRPVAAERPARLARPERIERDERSMVLTWLRAMQAEGLSLQAMANRLNNEGVPTVTGRGRWQKGTIRNLLAQTEE